MKDTLRQSLIQTRNSLSADFISDASQKICLSLFQIPELTSANSIAVYAAFQNEASLTLYYSKPDFKTFYFPKFRNNTYGFSVVEDAETQLTPGQFGVLEPLDELKWYNPDELQKRIDVWLIPGVGFDNSGNRLGRGKGYYDRLLANTSGHKIGIGFECQLVNKVPAENWDIKMDIIVTESKVIRP